MSPCSELALSANERGQMRSIVPRVRVRQQRGVRWRGRLRIWLGCSSGASTPEISKEPSAVLAREKGLTPERARVLPAAITTLAAVLEHFGRPTLVVAHGGIREGAILTMAGEATNRKT